MDYESMTRAELIDRIRSPGARPEPARGRTADGNDQETAPPEIERTRAEDELRRQNQLLDAIIDNLPVGLAIKEVPTLRDFRAQLSALAARFDAVKEEEMIGLARKIHDELGQVLTGLKMDLSWLGSRLPDNQPALRQKAAAMSELIDAKMQSVQNIAARLRPRMLDDLGLIPAVEWQAQEFQKRTDIRCELVTSVDANRRSARSSATRSSARTCPCNTPARSARRAWAASNGSWDMPGSEKRLSRA